MLFCKARARSSSSFEDEETELELVSGRCWLCCDRVGGGFGGAETELVSDPTEDDFELVSSRESRIARAISSSSPVCKIDTFRLRASNTRKI